MFRSPLRVLRQLFLPLILLVACYLFFFLRSRFFSISNEAEQYDEGWMSLPVLKERDVQGGGTDDEVEWMSTPMEDSFWGQSGREGCAERWIARGEVCVELEREDGWKGEARLDILWTWINGSSPPLLSLRKSLISSLESSPAYLQTSPRFFNPLSFGSEHLFREHGELKYSLRSVIPSFARYKGWGKLMVVSADVRRTVKVEGRNESAKGDMEKEERWGQVPVWFQDGKGLEVIHHSDLFSPSLKDVVPSFNSMAIESQFPLLLNILSNGEGSAKTVVYMNDDLFFLSPLPPSFFFSPVSGPVFRVQPDLLVDGKHPSTATRWDREGEWVGLRFANYILNERFGTRKRPYLQHTAKVLSLPILQEIRNIWGEELDTTGRSRFRGVEDEVSLTFLVVHYTIEKHRESLLYAWFSKVDSNRDGVLDVEEKKTIASLLLRSGTLKEDNEDVVRVRVLLSRLFALSFRKVFHPSNRIPSAGSSEHEEENLFNSVDGYPFFQPFPHLQTSKEVSDILRRNKLSQMFSRFPLPQELVGDDEAVCEISFQECFGKEEERTEDVFKRIAFERNEQCGDCVVVALLRNGEEKGLNNFLPLHYPEDEDYESIDSSALRIGMTKSFSKSSFPFPPTSSPASARTLFLRLLARYSYSLFDTPLLFHLIRSPVDLEREFYRLLPNAGLFRSNPTGIRRAPKVLPLPERPYKLLTLNDDLKYGRITTMMEMEELLGKFFEVLWGESKMEAKPLWEKDNTETPL
ncbi:hypothetical protein BT69DRAFT_1348276 [Atractiella rhizophila]|nr:hypothetical protein BT69DRAFT_1348276 [Atractiella rhizophila]